MTRINAGSTLANQYAPPFVVSDSVTTNWELRWNATLLAFEAFDPDALVVDIGFDTIQQQIFGGVSNQQVFVVPWSIDSTLTQIQQRAALYITINGLKQHTDTYFVSSSANATVVTLDTTIIGPDDIEIVGLQAGNGAFIELETAVGTGGASQDIDLTWFSPSEQTLIITVNGLRKHTDEYSISSISPFTTTTVTLTPAAGLNDDIEIIGITTTGEVPSSPVNATNLGSGPGLHGVFGAKRQIGEEQILDFKSLVAGSAAITLVSTVDNITIDTVVPTFANLGAGDQVLAPTPGTTDPLDLHSVSGGDRTAISLAGGVLTFNHLFGYRKDGSAGTVDALTGDRIIGVSNTGVPVTVNLLAIAELPAGDTITIKDESGGAAANNITVTPASETIDSAGTHVINTNFGYVTLYSDGTNYFIISGA